MPFRILSFCAPPQQTSAASNGRRRRLHVVPPAIVQVPVGIATTAGLAGSVGTALQGAVSDGVITRQLQQQGVAPSWPPGASDRLGALRAALHPACHVTNASLRW